MFIYCCFARYDAGWCMSVKRWLLMRCASAAEETSAVTVAALVECCCCCRQGKLLLAVG